MNLSAPFLCQFFKDPMHTILPYCDYIFGNETEAAAFAENNGFGECSVAEIAKKIAQLPKENQKRKRTVVITQVKIRKRQNMEKIIKVKKISKNSKISKKSKIKKKSKNIKKQSKKKISKTSKISKELKIQKKKSKKSKI